MVLGLKNLHYKERCRELKLQTLESDTSAPGQFGTNRLVPKCQFQDKTIMKNGCRR